MTLFVGACQCCSLSLSLGAGVVSVGRSASVIAGVVSVGPIVVVVGG